MLTRIRVAFLHSSTLVPRQDRDMKNELFLAHEVDVARRRALGGLGAGIVADGVAAEGRAAQQPVRSTDTEGAVMSLTAPTKLYPKPPFDQ